MVDVIMKTALVAPLLLFLVTSLLGDQIPPFFIDSVVALGRIDAKPNGQPPEWVTEASGFLYGYLVKDDSDLTKRLYEVYLVTNRHVLANHAYIFVRLNPEKATDRVKQFPLALQDDKGQPQWFSHPDQKIDISVVQLNIQYLREQGLKSDFFGSDAHAADKSKMKDLGLAAGDGIFVLGFPMGMSGAQWNYVIARRGSIARISDLLDSISNTFLIDALIFPGNSGGPVVSAISVASIQGTKSQTSAYLIGVVRGYLPYSDVAVSQQTGQLRTIFQENSGLAEVVPIDYVNETIKSWQAFRNAPTTAPK
jgi:S1-C subfamily serine protease